MQNANTKEQRNPKKAGMAPGSQVYVGTPPSGSTQIHVITYEAETISEKQVNLEECLKLIREPSDKRSLWIDVRGLGEAKVVSSVGEALGLHPLTSEDILNTTKRPKSEVFDDYTLVLLKMIYPDAAGKFQAEQVSLVVRAGIVASFQEGGSDTFEAVRNRLRQSRGKIRTAGVPYLFYALVDSIVDGYFAGIEQIGEELSTVEQLVLSDPSPRIQARLIKLKRTAMYIRRAVWPVREIVNSLLRGDSVHMTEDLKPYLTDVYDHAIEVLDILESDREMVAGLLDLHVATVGNRLNQIMKVLTVFSAIFMPLTFIAGIYGMNFQYMPELHWLYGYPAALGLMAATAIGLLVVFRAKKWL